MLKGKISVAGDEVEYKVIDSGHGTKEWFGMSPSGSTHDIEEEGFFNSLEEAIDEYVAKQYPHGAAPFYVVSGTGAIWRVEILLPGSPYR